MEEVMMWKSVAVSCWGMYTSLNYSIYYILDFLEALIGFRLCVSHDSGIKSEKIKYKYKITKYM
jgi:hypothetical protein